MSGVGGSAQRMLRHPMASGSESAEPRAVIAGRAAPWPLRAGPSAWQLRVSRGASHEHGRAPVATAACSASRRLEFPRTMRATSLCSVGNRESVVQFWTPPRSTRQLQCLRRRAPRIRLGADTARHADCGYSVAPARIQRRSRRPLVRHLVSGNATAAQHRTNGSRARSSRELPT